MLEREFLIKLAGERRLSQMQREIFLEKFVGARPGSVKNDADVASALNYSPKTVSNSMSAVYKKFGLTEKGPAKANRLFGVIFENQLKSQGVPEEQARKELYSVRPSSDKDSLIESPLLKLNSRFQNRIKKHAINLTSSVQREKNLMREELRDREEDYRTLTESELNRRVDQKLNFKKKMSILSEDLSLPKKTVGKFFSCDPINREDFIIICKSLKEVWVSIADERFTQVVIEIVPEVKQAIYDDIQDMCGTLQILEVERPISVDDLYVDVNILSVRTRYSKKKISDLPAIYNVKTKETDRFAHGSIDIPRVPGKKAATEHEKMMIFGKPGAGKTTFLKHIAIQCNEDAFQPYCIPVFVQLRTYVTRAEKTGSFSLEKYIIESLSSAIAKLGRGNFDIDEIIRYGRLLILLDGLDEVPPEHAASVVNDIEILQERFKKNRIVITCRIAAHEYFFKGFVKVEISDFNSEQIADFSKKWFAFSLGGEKAANISSEFIEKIHQTQHEQIRELAVTPILLVLACLVFQEKEQFPENRHQLYKAGIDILLSKWDEARQIKKREGSNLYKSLRIEEKRELFSFVAASTFQDSEYYFEREKLQQLISEYMSINFLRYKKKQDLTGETELNSTISAIAAQHGLIIERATNIFSFSHLTFQEYFAAENIVKRKDSEISQQIIQSITEKRYLEIYLLAAEMLGKADSLLFERKREIDAMLADDMDLQEFLKWLDRKSNFDNSSREPLALRAFYFDCYIHKIGWQNKSEDALSISVSKPVSWALNGSSSRASDLHSDYSIIKILALIPKNRPPYELDFGIYKLIEQDLLRARNLSKDYDFRQALDKLRNNLPEEKEFLLWWPCEGLVWIKKFLKITRNHRLLGRDWRFSKSQNENLLEYYQANVGLVNRLNTKALMSSGFRKELRATMLMPLST